MKNLKIFLLAIPFFVSFLCFAQTNNSNGSKKNVLMISSFSDATYWGKSIISGFKTAFTSDEYHVVCEETETWENMGETYSEKDLSFILRHFKTTAFDIIVVIDPPAINMVLENLEKFPKDVKILLSGTIGEEPEEAKGHSNITTMNFPLAVEGNINIGMRMFPDTKTIVSITDGSEDGIIEEEYVKTIVKHMKERNYDALPSFNVGVPRANLDGVEFVYLNGRDYSTKEAMERLTLAAQGPMFVIHYGWGSPKDAITEEQGVYSKMFSEAVDRRMFGFFDDSEDFVLGGYMTNGVQLGAFIGEKAKALIAGNATIDLYEAMNVIALKINWKFFSEKNFQIDMMPAFTVYYDVAPKLWDLIDYRYVSAIAIAIALMALSILFLSYRTFVISRRNSILFKNLPSSLYVFSADGSISYAYAGSKKESGKMDFIWDLGGEFTREYKKNEDAIKRGERVYLEFSQDGKRRKAAVTKVSDDAFGGDTFIASTIDITDLENSKLKFQELALNMETMLRSIGDAIIAADKHGKITFINDVAKNLLGYPAQDALGMDLDSVYEVFSCFDDSPITPPTRRAYMNFNETPEKGIYLIDKNGRRRLISDNVSQISMNKEFLGSILVFRDVTKDHQQKEELIIYSDQQKIINDCLSYALSSSNSEDTTKKILQLLGENVNADRAFVFRYDKVKRALINAGYWNSSENLADKHFDITQIPVSAFAGWMEKFGRTGFVSFDDMGDDEETLFAPLRKVLFEQGGIKSCTMAGIYEDGVLCGFIGVDFVSKYYKFTKYDHRILRSLAKIAELDSEKHRHMEKSKTVENERRLILDSILVPIMLFNGSAELLFMNNAARETPGLKELCLEACREGALTEETCVVKRAIKDKSTSRIDGNLNGRDIITIGTPVFDADGEIINIIVNLTDVTDITDANKKLMKAMEAAKESERAKSYFLATMSHELRTPLNAVVGYSELTQNPSLNQEQRIHNLKNINFAANTLLNLINDILDLSKLEAGQLGIFSSPLDMKALMTEFTNIFKFAANKKGIYLRTSVQEDIPTIMMDSLRLKQILMNIIGNAIKFTLRGGVDINVSFKASAEKSGTLTISVKDSGMGISLENQGKIFNPFEQDSKQRVRGRGAIEGTGLGLAIVKRLLEKMNGKVELESVPEEGSTFTLTFSEVQTSSEKPDEIVSRKAIASKKVNMDEYEFPVSVLIVDDVVLNLKVLKNMLKNMGAEVTEASSGTEGLEVLKKIKPDIIMTDLWMPEMSGEEFAKEIKNNSKNSDIPIVAVTADTQVKDDDKVFDDVLFKPITMLGIFTVLNRHIPEKRKKKEEAEK